MAPNSRRPLGRPRPILPVEWRRWSLYTLLVPLAVAPLYAASPTELQVQFFEREIRPLLAEHCYECHSGRAEKLQAGLRLDSRAAMLRGGDSGAAIEPENPDESLLVQAVRYENYEMPPRGKLPDRAVATLEKWIAMGAPWPDEPEPEASRPKQGFDWRQRKASQWCWQPIHAPDPPAVRRADWPRNPIDHFVLARLEDADLAPATDAEERTLIRRLYFDLIGLPPTPEEIRRFLTDDGPDAYDRLIDRLLDSPRFGEKWARHWLDLVRYAETCGHEFDYPLPYAYRYRDYLIRALNADVPYDELIYEHIAGDLLDPPRRHATESFNESIIGTGFWFLGEAVHAPTDVRADEADRIDNQIDVMAKTFLGLTVACARCHDHKFDPISTQDYYALAGYLQSSRRQEAMLDPHHRIRHARRRLARLHARGTGLWHDQLEKVVETQAGSLPDALVAAVARESGAPTPDWSHPLYALHRLATVPAKDYLAQADALRHELRRKRHRIDRQLAQTELFADFRGEKLDGWYRTGEAFAAAPTRPLTWQPYQEDPLSRPRVMHTGLYGTKLRGVLRSPTFELRHKQIHYRMNAQAAEVRLIVDGYTMDTFNSLLFADISLEEVNTNDAYQWVTQHRDLDHYLGHRAHLEIIDHGGGFVALDEVRFSDADAPDEPPHPWNLAVLGRGATSVRELAEAYTEEIHGMLHRAASGELGRAETDALNWLVRTGLVPAPPHVSGVASEMTTIDQATPPPRHVMALADGDGENERVFIRGSHQNLGPVAPRRLLTALEGEDQTPPPRGSGRLDLARGIADTRNPLTARVAVNRLWQHLFGRGIVPTVDDFGKMGQPPSHPALLDWLADDFMHRHGWSLKKTIRQLVRSRTYRMASHSTVDATRVAESDPANVLLHRARIRRLTAEGIRDSLLAISGQLDDTMFGPSIPVHLTPFMEGRGRPQSGPLDGRGRRSLYVEVRRNFLSPLMLAFDMPIPFNTMGRRGVSNVPAQSLILMNDPLILQQARHWAKSLLENRALESDQQRITYAFQAAFARPPSPGQLRRCQDWLAGQAERVGKSRPEAEEWSDLCHMLINMKPFIFVH